MAPFRTESGALGFFILRTRYCHFYLIVCYFYLMKMLFDRYALHVAFVVAWVATLGSLFFSEVLHFAPCTLCWYQRIAMYPLAFILLVAVLRKDTHVYRYVLPLSIVGAAIALYHYLLQKTTWVMVVTPCTAASPCTELQIDLLGFITIPFMALAAFSSITFLMWYIRKQHEYRT